MRLFINRHAVKTNTLQHSQFDIIIKSHVHIWMTDISKFIHWMDMKYKNEGGFACSPATPTWSPPLPPPLQGLERLIITVWETSVSRHNVGLTKALPLKPQYATVLWWSEGFRGALNVPLSDICTSDRVCFSSVYAMYTEKSFQILLNQTEIRLYLSCTDWFGTANGRVRLEILNTNNWK